MFACLFRPPLADRDHPRGDGDRSELLGQEAAESALKVVDALVSLAAEFSPRYERLGDDLVVIDVSGLDRLIGPSRVIGEELRREALARGISAHVAIACTQTAALVLALARPGLTIVDPGREAEALARLPIAIVEKASAVLQPSREVERQSADNALK